MADQLPNLWYIGDAVVGVVSECTCEPIEVPHAVLSFVGPPHEGHDIVPVRSEDELPEGVDFEHYKRWCRMFAASSDLLAACKAARAFGAQGETDEGISVSYLLDEAIKKAEV